MEQKNILIITDDPDVLYTYRLILTSGGFSHKHIKSIEKPDSLPGKMDFDLALIDIEPQTTHQTKDVLETIRQMNPDLPVIQFILTEDIIANKPAEANVMADNLLEKPVDADQLMEAVHHLLSKETE